MNFGIAFLWKVPNYKEPNDLHALAPLLPFFTKLLELKDLAITRLKVWVSIMASTIDDHTTFVFINTYYNEYNYVLSMYKPCKSEWLNDVTN